MSHVGADGATVVADALDEIDFDRLRPQAGRFDLQALADLQAPLTRVRDALVELQQTSQDVRSPWLVNRATYELDDFDESVAEHLPALQNALRGDRAGARDARGRRAAHLPAAVHHAVGEPRPSAGSSAATPSSPSPTASSRSASSVAPRTSTPPSSRRPRR